MSETPLLPEQCETMAEVRAAIDELDVRIVDLLSLRFGYMRAAARIKAERGQVRDETRKAQVIAQALARAETLDLPGDVIADVWEALVEGSIAYELRHWDNGRA